MEQILAVDASKNTIELVIVGLDPAASKIPAETISIIETLQCEHSVDTSLAETLEAASKKLKNTWESTIVLLPGQGHLSMNVTMPFADSKKVAKLITAEVQDTLPITTDEFVIDFNHVGKVNGSGEDFHVGLYPVQTVAQLTSGLKDSTIEPRIITTPASALGGLYEIFPDELDSNAVVLYETTNWLYFSIILNGKLIGDRAVNMSLVSTAQCEGIIEAAIRSTEERYETTIQMIYRISDTIVEPRIQGIGNRTSKDLSMISLFPSARERVSLPALLAAIFVRSYPSPRILNNFRSGKFRFFPSVSYLKKACKSLSPYLFLLTLVLLLTFAGWYAAREYTIQSLQKEVTLLITKEIPNFKADPGSEAQALQLTSQGLQDSLKDLGSPLAAPPLNVLSALSEDLSSIEGITVSRVTVRNGEVKIDGTVPNYRNKERLEAILKKRKAVFCRIKTDTSSSSGRENGKDFQVTLTLCE
jgi:hypothetical protein